MFKRLCIGFVLVLAACGDTTTEPRIGGTDAGPDANLDAGTTEPTDSGGTEDSGSTNDAAEPDFGDSEPDVGDGSDAGSGMSDSGAMDMGGADPCTDPYSPVANPPATPPLGGTSFETDDLITDADPTSFGGLTYKGQGMRQMFDRRVNAFITVNAHLFDAQFGTTRVVEVRVNPEFSQADAQVEATTYATALGRIPDFLFRHIEEMSINDGREPFGGGTTGILVHTLMGEDYAARGSLEEILIHEATHTSIDRHHRDEARWQAAQTADGSPLSPYAQQFPDREDLAESLGPYLAYRFRPNRITAQKAQTIAETIPNRIQYFDCQGWDMNLVP